MSISSKYLSLEALCQYAREQIVLATNNALVAGDLPLYTSAKKCVLLLQSNGTVPALIQVFLVLKGLQDYLDTRHEIKLAVAVDELDLSEKCLMGSDLREVAELLDAMIKYQIQRAAEQRNG